MRCKRERGLQARCYIPAMLHQLRSAIFIKPETNWQMVSPAFHFQFITVDTTIDLFYSLVGHFRALYQICRSLGVDNGRG